MRHPIPGTKHARLPTPVGGWGVSPVPRADKVVLSSQWLIGMGVRHTMNIFGMAPFGFNTQCLLLSAPAVHLEEASETPSSALHLRT
jgi:hypothetical protein